MNKGLSLRSLVRYIREDSNFSKYLFRLSRNCSYVFFEIRKQSIAELIFFFNSITINIIR